MNQYQRITRAFKQAPWRLQTQLASAGAAVLVICLVAGGLFLADASRTATLGREVQSLEARKDQLTRQNAELRAHLAGLRSAYRMHDRARELGYLPASSDQVEYLLVNGYMGPRPMSLVVESPLTVELAFSPTPVPDFTETLGERLAQVLYGINAEAAGEAPR